MRTIKVEEIIAKVEKMCIRANCSLNPDITEALEAALQNETTAVSKSVLHDLIKNAEIANNETIPVCQDTGMAVFFVEIGEDVHVLGSIKDAINEGVRRGYKNGCLRKSVVGDPLRRINTEDNTPAVIYYDFVPGDEIKITLAPKGFGSENKSALKMLNPSDDISGVIDFVVETVKKAGPNPCPPVVVGVGIGGTMDKCAQLSKKALTRSINENNPDPYYADLEKTLLQKINKLGIGPGGFGGKTTALSVNIEVYPTHIAGLPVSVNISCHATRHAVEVI